MLAILTGVRWYLIVKAEEIFFKAFDVSGLHYVGKSRGLASQWKYLEALTALPPF